MPIMNKKVVPIICVINDSDNMQQNIVDKLNMAMHNLSQVILELPNKYEECDFKISVVMLSNDKKPYCKLIDIEDFYWKDLKKSDIQKNIDGFRVLSAILNDYKNMIGATEYYTPIIILLSPSHIKEEFLGFHKEMCNHFLYRDALKIAIVINEENGNPNRMIEYTKKTNIIFDEDIQAFKDIIIPSKKSNNDRLGSSFKISYPSRSIESVSDFMTLQRCQLMPCTPENANDVVLKLSPRDDCVIICNESRFRLIATLIIKEGENISIPHEENDVFEVYSKSSNIPTSLSVKVESDSLGFLNINNTSNNEIYIRHIVEKKGMPLRPGDSITIGNGEKILEVLKD